MAILGYPDRPIEPFKAREFEPPPPPDTLAGWLYVATGQFALPAKERIRLEIEGHYTEAVKAHLALSISESDAAKAALAELGNPKVAARRFRRRHLTEREVETFESQINWGRSIPFLLLHCIYFVLFIKLRFHHPEEYGIISMIAGFLLLIVWPAFSVFKARRSRATMGACSRFLLIMYMQRVPIFVFIQIMPIIDNFSRSRPATIFTWIILSSCSLFLSITLFRANRLRKADEIWKDTPLNPSVSS